MNEYQSSALEQGIIFVVILLAASLILFISSKNKSLIQRILVSSYPAIFVLGEIYALIASTYYVQGSWDNGSYVSTESGTILKYILYGIFIAGITLGVYSSSKFEGNKYLKLIIIPVLLVSFILFFIAGMTLTRDWI